ERFIIKSRSIFFRELAAISFRDRSFSLYRQIGQQAIGRFVIRGDKGGRAAGDKRGANAGRQKPGVNHWRNPEVRSVFVRQTARLHPFNTAVRREVRANVSKKIRFDLAEKRVR